MDVIIIVVLVVGLVFGWLLLSYIPVRLWVAAWATGVRIDLRSGNLGTLPPTFGLDDGQA